MKVEAADEAADTKAADEAADELADTEAVERPELEEWLQQQEADMTLWGEGFGDAAFPSVGKAASTEEKVKQEEEEEGQ